MWHCKAEMRRGAENVDDNAHNERSHPTLLWRTGGQLTDVTRKRIWRCLLKLRPDSWGRTVKTSSVATAVTGWLEWTLNPPASLSLRQVLPLFLTMKRNHLWWWPCMTVYLLEMLSTVKNTWPISACVCSLYVANWQKQHKEIKKCPLKCIKMDDRCFSHCKVHLVDPEISAISHQQPAFAHLTMSVNCCGQD